MELYSAPTGCASHGVRIALAEKGVEVKVHSVDPNEPPEDLPDWTPYRSLPTLVDRDLVLYDYRVIMEYLDERFPHPPLLPPDPISRARARLALNRIDHDWYSLLPQLELGERATRERARSILEEGLTASASLFNAKPFFLSDEFSMLDSCLGPLLWRLPHYGIALPKAARPVLKYADNLFDRVAFRRSLSPAERAMAV